MIKKFGPLSRQNMDIKDQSGKTTNQQTSRNGCVKMGIETNFPRNAGERTRLDRC